MDETKICTLCNQKFPATTEYFYKKKFTNGVYGLNSRCIKCIRALDKEKRDKRKKKKLVLPGYKLCSKCGHILPATKEFYNASKTGVDGLVGRCRQCTREESRKYRREHKEEMSSYNKQWRQNNPDYGRQWNLDNQDKKFNYQQKRRTKEDTCGDGFTKEQWKEMMDFFDWKCAYSGESFNQSSHIEKRTIDHIIALDNNGLNEIWNLVPMKLKYNSSKQTEDMITWYKRQEFFDIDKLMKIYEWQEYAFEKYGLNR